MMELNALEITQTLLENKLINDEEAQLIAAYLAG
jgi:hypothetical protein